MRNRNRTESVIRAGAGLVLVVMGVLFVALLALLIARSVPIDEGKQWSSRIPLGTYATAGYLRGGL
ncbi:hypothetical protein [Rhizobium wuzhouense]|uniref:Uncharacterized protein n=1 Tax=Rhizobium wuzhouense TaxID=1986026 RepID=A0ABX5NPL6_9HYPH|nr:hypothetical protein [Rhizobium wuzhouense]PYB71295.1 hypothetical protein DMY87_18230 [Rhizobium wuzhouense]